jgi:tetratricopeptide (TPR) repeat protein
MSELMQLAIYNPDMLSSKDFLAAFVARQDTVEILVRQLREITPKGLAKHRLILGQRGMGKTSLLRRLAIAIDEDAQLNERLLPLSFREEQYNVNHLHSFWCNCLDALANYFDRHGRHDQAEEVDRQLAGLMQNRRGKNKVEDEDGGAALATLKAWAKREGKRLVLLLDNIDLILEGLKKQDWALRRSLQEAGGIVVIGASAAYLEATVNPKAAFYDFFQVTTLQRLSAAEMLACLRRLATERGEVGKPVLHLLGSDPGRIRALYDLTGGNPRTLILLYTLLESDAGQNIMGDLERLLDEVTVLYKARVEDLAPQARVVLDAAALHWDPVTAAQLAQITGMETSAVSAQVDRLLKNGILEKTSTSTSSRNAFQIGERFFNIWYLMRHGQRRQRTRLRWLTGFLRSFYTPQQLQEKALGLLRRDKDSDLSSHYALALGDAMDDSVLRNLLGQEVHQQLARLVEKEGKRLEELTDPADFPKPQTAREWSDMGYWLHVELSRYDEAESAYRQAIALDPKDALPWFNLGNLLKSHLGRYDEAESAYRQAIALDPKDARPWNNLGNLLQDHLGRYDEAESAYRQAIALDPKDADPWNNLGNLLQDHLGRYDEAESTYRQAIALDPKAAGSWINLGNLLQDHLGRYDEAECAYRQMLSISPDALLAHCNLSYLLLSQQQDTQPHLAQALAGLPAHGRALLQAFAALAQDNFGAATEALQQALESDHAELFSFYLDDLLRNLRLAAKKGYGEKLLAWLEASGMADKYWPLYTAFDAYLHGEEKLRDVNPEVRTAAERLYRWLASVPAPGNSD